MLSALPDYVFLSHTRKVGEQLLHKCLNWRNAVKTMVKLRRNDKITYGCNFLRAVCYEQNKLCCENEICIVCRNFGKVQDLSRSETYTRY